jgi:hypothetical protein
MMFDLTPLANSMEPVASGVLAIAVAAMAAMVAWDWIRARLIEQWDRDHRR